MRDKKPRPLKHPAYQKQREELLSGYDSLDEEDRETVRLAAHGWGFMISTIPKYWRIEDGEWEKPKILGSSREAS